MEGAGDSWYYAVRPLGQPVDFVVPRDGVVPRRRANPGEGYYLHVFASHGGAIAHHIRSAEARPREIQLQAAPATPDGPDPRRLEWAGSAGEGADSPPSDLVHGLGASPPPGPWSQLWP